MAVCKLGSIASLITVIALAGGFSRAALAQAAKSVPEPVVKPTTPAITASTAAVKNPLKEATSTPKPTVVQDVSQVTPQVVVSEPPVKVASNVASANKPAVVENVSKVASQVTPEVTPVKVASEVAAEPSVNQEVAAEPEPAVEQEVAAEPAVEQEVIEPQVAPVEANAAPEPVEQEVVIENRAANGRTVSETRAVAEVAGNHSMIVRGEIHVPDLNFTIAYRRPVRARDLMTGRERAEYRRALNAAATIEARQSIRETTYARLSQRAWERGMAVIELGSLRKVATWNERVQIEPGVEPHMMHINNGHMNRLPPHH